MRHPRLDRSTLGALWAGGAAILFVAACSPTDRQTGPEVERFVPPGAEAVALENFRVCKEYTNVVGPSVTFDYTVEFEFNASKNISSSVVLADGECATIHTYDQDGSQTGTEHQTVTVTEQVPSGFDASYVLSHIDAFGGPVITEPEVSGNSASGVMISNPDNGFEVVFLNAANPVEVNGRMTGGGHQFTVDGARVTRGMTLHCDILLSNNLEINWPGGNNWHLEKENLSDVTCIDDPAFSEEPPRAPFNTFIAEGVGSLNGVAGSIIRFKFIDDGEPGTTDEAYIQIWAPGDDPDTDVPVLDVGGTLTHGNVQAHFDQPHK